MLETSARVAAQWIREGRDGQFDELHALNNLEYSYLQLGKYGQAQQIVRKLKELSRQPHGDPWAPIDARIYYDVDTQDWHDALQIEAPAGSPFDEDFDVFWIHTVASARLSKPEEAAVSLEQFRKSSKQWITGHGWGDVLHLSLAEAEAWTLFSQGQHGKAVHELRQAAHFEQDHPLYYADILPRPASEMLGDMLRQMGRSKEAMAAYKASLVLAPKRSDSLAGEKACSVTPGR